MTKYILSGGLLHVAEDGGRALFEEMVKDIEGPVKILNCTFARRRDEWEETCENDRKRVSLFLSDWDVEVLLAQPETFLEQLQWANVLNLKGGDTGVLCDLLKSIGDWTKYLDGKVVVGSSAGAEVLCRYYTWLDNKGKIFEGEGLVPVKFICHWQSNSDEYAGIDWQQLYQSIEAYGEPLPIVVLREGEFRVFV